MTEKPLPAAGDGCRPLVWLLESLALEIPMAGPRHPVSREPPQASREPGADQGEPRAP